jgi:predicted small secreted protein
MKKIALLALLALAGCNTIAGIGQDITGAANTVADAL